MTDCTHDCSSCGQSCPSRNKPKKLPKDTGKGIIKKVYAVVSGKGGVGKSTVSATLASTASKMGRKVALLDADITGPSIPKLFGVHQRADAVADGILPIEVEGVKIMSTNLLLETETSPVVWRGPILGNVVQQFWNDVYWGDVDVMFIDMPPGTGDVPLTVYQNLPIDGIIIVSTPQQLVSMIVQKAVEMAKLMDIEIVGLVENMSYMNCPNCDEKLYLFGESQLAKTANDLQVFNAVQLPFDTNVARLCDEGKAFEVEREQLVELLEGLL
ncbi:MAG: Mrp/NBP35 family ATP-binding protein [Clostridia bacterium]|nr:Mrp/NBP35 family ATP-binding protein [Clostridia bacterium]